MQGKVLGNITEVDISPNRANIAEYLMSQIPYILNNEVYILMRLLGCLELVCQSWFFFSELYTYVYLSGTSGTDTPLIN